MTGVLELLAAAGLLHRRTAPWAAGGLTLLLVAMFPANVHAALAGLMLNGAPATALLPRTLMQLVFAAATAAVVLPYVRALPRRRSAAPRSAATRAAGHAGIPEHHQPDHQPDRQTAGRAPRGEQQVTNQNQGGGGTSEIRLTAGRVGSIADRLTTAFGGASARFQRIRDHGRSMSPSVLICRGRRSSGDGASACRE